MIRAPLLQGSATALRWLTAGAAVALLSACGNNDMSQLQDYVERTKTREGGAIEPIPEMETFETYRYPDDPGRDPFTTLSFAKPESARTDEPDCDQEVSPNTDRPQEPLEQFALDSLSYVGTLEQNKASWALVEDPGGTVHQVREGDYIGKNYGRIESITAQAIQLREFVEEDACWQQREQSLALDDGATGS